MIKDGMSQLLQLLEDNDSEVQIAGANMIVKLAEYSEL
jgi:hypothetical protein